MQALIYFQLLFFANADCESLCPVPTTIISRADAVKVANKCGDSFLAVKVCTRIKPIGLGLELQSIVGRNIRQSFSVNAKCSASGQSQTGTREAPTITQAPVHSEEKSPQLDDGDSGFPPCDDNVDGGNWSGGFFLLGFLTFLGFLKDKESEEDYQDSRR
ncbi:hypothetical protein Goari_010312 [Gossypium aridum]|uniref:Uncharacterized protein n=1 Tax=Gossypium aridum TaxID=34290 RepID=A0A7J8XZQ7_GOSAI|nr:hypothetical protein [Gossypium aridum]